MARFLADGTPDSDFGDGDLDDDGISDDDPSLASYVGITIDWLGGTVNDMAIDPLGNIVTFGDITLLPESDSDFFLTRYLPEGLLDVSFGP